MADNKDKKIICPACGEETEKIYMPDAGVYLDVCTKGCGGIFFDNREFKKFDENNEDITALEEALSGKEFKKTDESKTRICPLCGMKMIKNFASAKGEVQIDECYGCGAKFLDYEEIQKIRAEYINEEERAKDAVKQFKDSMKSDNSGVISDEIYLAAKKEYNSNDLKYENMKMNRKPIFEPLTKITRILFNRYEYGEKHKKAQAEAIQNYIDSNRTENSGK